MISSYHDSVKDVQAKFGDRSDIAAAANSPFDRFEWFTLLEKTGLTPLYACAGDGDAAAMLALKQSGRCIEALRNWYAFTWRAHAASTDKGDALLAHIAERLKTRAHRVTLEPMPDEDGSAQRLASAFSTAGWRVEVTQCDLNHTIQMCGRSFAQYWQTRPGPLRTTLKRKGKLVETQIATEFDADLWAHYEQIYAKSWKPQEDHPEMLRAFAEAEANAGRLRLGLAIYEGTPVAAQFWTVEGGCAYIHKLAHLDEHRKLSAGTTLSAALFEHAIDQDRVDTIDFGTGDQPYKADWMEETRPRYRIDCLNMKSPHAWADLAKLCFHRLQADTVPMLAREPAAG